MMHSIKLAGMKKNDNKPLVNDSKLKIIFLGCKKTFYIFFVR
jgi:hypothetical protein